MRRLRQRGQTLMEYILLFTGVIVPLTFGLIAIAQMMWVWHSMVDYTQMGARYATTHCWQSDGQNVIGWMRQNVPPIPDQASFRDGSVDIVVEYYKLNPDTRTLEAFSCDSDCSAQCVPDTVSVRITNYEFRPFMAYLGLPPVQMPDFTTTMPVESVGCDPDTGTCTP